MKKPSKAIAKFLDKNRISVLQKVDEAFERHGLNLTTHMFDEAKALNAVPSFKDQYGNRPATQNRIGGEPRKGPWYY